MRRKLQTLDEAWVEYSDAIFSGAPVGATQYAETKQAFMAGALVVLQAAEAIGEPDVSEEEGMAWMTAAMQECVEYHRNRIKSRTEEN